MCVFLQIMSIPRLSERLECMQYRRKLDLDIEEIRPDLNIFRNACQELRSSLKFKSTLHVSCPVLLHRVYRAKPTNCVGRPDAREYSQWRYFPRKCSGLSARLAVKGNRWRFDDEGILISIFSQMKETKTAKGGPECPTLLHYLARVLLRKDPSMVNFIEDLPSLEAAARGALD